MTKLLYIESSPRKERSSSIALAHQFLSQYRALYPQDECTTLDLWQKKLPPFNNEILNAKYNLLHGRSHSQAEKAAWKEVESIIEEFKGADKLLFSLPMWNFSIPYVLKHYIDLVVQPGYTFALTDEGYRGLCLNKKAVLVYASGGEYGHAEHLDFQKPYMKNFLNFIGITDIQTVTIAPTMGGEEKKNQALQAAKERITQLVKEF